MKGIITIILCFILFIGIVLAILFHESVRNFKRALEKAAEEREARRMAREDEYFKRTSTKHYREDDSPKFKDDYFKSNEEEKYEQQEPQQKDATTRRTVETGSGITIIDERTEEKAERKIFDKKEGEYVEFEEV